MGEASMEDVLGKALTAEIIGLGCQVYVGRNWRSFLLKYKLKGIPG